MFPYPSGDGLHVGHVRIYTAVDVMARYFRARGDEVMSPMGWDAFGLPAENAAIKNKMNPQDIVPRNYNNFRKQMQNMQFSFDWEHEFATTDPTYYGLTQWIFLELYKKGLVYREQVAINWCPKCMTGLANEEVLADGTHERCGTVTGKKMLPQWVMKITKYADRLLNDLDGKSHSRNGKPGNLHSGNENGLDWPRGILEMQRNWIGKKEGVVIHHKVKDMKLTLDTFSAFPAWLWADTFIVVAPEHPMVKELVKGTKQEKEVKEFVTESAKITNQQRVEDKFEKKGVFTGKYAEDPFNPGSSMPIWVANFAMMDFGTGIIRCSAHDVRDYEFAQKYGIELHEVVERTAPNMPINAHDNSGILKNSGPFTGKSISQKLIGEILDWIVEQKIGERRNNYHLRDWVFSRQRYWGEPIPLVFCAQCAQSKNDKCTQIVEKDGKKMAVIALTEKDLPLTLPYLESYEPTETGESPLSRVTDWVNCKCPKCGGEAKRETDTMPNWAGSCWYHLAFAFWRGENHKSQMTNSKQITNVHKLKSTKEILDEFKKKSEKPYSDFWKEFAQPKIEKWLPVDWYLGGAEHAVLHLLYARFWNKVLYDLGHLSFVEPYLRLRSVGIVLAEDGRKMSKSWGNVINPDDVVKVYGSDAVRLYEMFMGPWDQAISWDSRALVGMKRFLERAVEVSQNEKKKGEKSSPQLVLKLAKLIKQVERGITEQKFNTAIAGCMEFVNEWRNNDYKLSQDQKQMFAQILSPFAPTTAKEIWDKAEKVGWPSLEEVVVGDVTVTIAVQINGKLRSTLNATSNTAKIQEEVVKIAMEDERVKKWVTGEVKKVIFIPGKIINLIV